MTITSRLRAAAIYPRPATRTKHFTEWATKKTVPYIILFKMLLHLFIRTKWNTI